MIIDCIPDKASGQLKMCIMVKDENLMLKIKTLSQKNCLNVYFFIKLKVLMNRKSFKIKKEFKIIVMAWTVENFP